MILFFMSLLFALFESKQLLTSELSSVDKLALANNKLAFKLHETFSFDGNFILSPLSIFTALGMLYIGARGVTAEEIRSALSYDTTGLNDESINQYFQNLLLSFVDTSEEYRLEIANALISQKKFPVLKEYKEVLMDYYGAIVKEVDFTIENTKAVDEINIWVRNNTQGKITKLLESLDRDTVLVLLNAVYFKGKWEAPFEPSLTEKGTFYNNGIDAVTVPMMVHRYYFFYGKFPEHGVQALKMPYLGGRISMLVLLPLQRNGLRIIEEKLTSIMLDNITTNLKEKNVIIKLPKFKLEHSQKLKLNLALIGMKSAFTNSANFGGINKGANLTVSKIVHKATIDVNEAGTEATGGSAFVFFPRTTFWISYFTVEHPFLFFIRDDTNGMILFSGRVNEL